MIVGRVTGGREARVSFQIQGANGIIADLDAVIDTGFTEHLTLSQAWINSLALPLLETDRMVLADGTEVAVNLYEGTILWELGERAIPIHCLEGIPLVGMSLLWESFVSLEVREGGAVTIAVSD
jgi:predicted aspartyl protease